MGLKRKLIPKMYINVIEDMCEGVCTSVKSMYEEIKKLKIKIDVYQRSVLSPYLLSIVMNEFKRYTEEGICYLWMI